jgi:hypothetical protein
MARTRISRRIRTTAGTGLLTLAWVLGLTFTQASSKPGEQALLNDVEQAPLGYAQAASTGAGGSVDGTTALLEAAI